jgi:putative ABC transport system ATP-binding protein
MYNSNHMAVEIGAGFIELRAVSKKYKRGREVVAALDNINLSIRRGELLAIVGPSGAGKTTLSHVIGGLTTPDSGSITINGKQLSQRSDRALSRYRNNTVGFVFQSFSLISGYSALENVMVPLMVAGMRPGERRKVARHYLDIVGLNEQATQPVEQLSGGQRQRVSIARALVHHPQILIADEPTGSLDSARGHEIMQILDMLSRREHITVIMVTHDEQLARRADRIIHIADGGITKELHP